MAREWAEYMARYLPALMGWDVIAEQIKYKGKKQWVATVRDGDIPARHYAKINGVMTELKSGRILLDYRN